MWEGRADYFPAEGRAPGSGSKKGDKAKAKGGRPIPGAAGARVAVLPLPLAWGEQLRGRAAVLGAALGWFYLVRAIQGQAARGGWYDEGERSRARPHMRPPGRQASRALASPGACAPPQASPRRTRMAWPAAWAAARPRPPRSALTARWAAGGPSLTGLLGTERRRQRQPRARLVACSSRAPQAAASAGCSRRRAQRRGSEPEPAPAPAAGRTSSPRSCRRGAAAAACLAAPHCLLHCT